MRTHTNNYKNAIKQFGRQIDAKITYTINNQEIILGNNELFSVTPILNAELLKSAMKQLDIESKIDIPLNTILNFKQGVLINNAYEYLDYGNYVVYESEYQADTKSYVITCYDKMLYSMQDYVTPIINDAPITYPITIKNYLIAIATHLGLEFEDSTFTNQDKEIPNELYLDSVGRSLGYTFRDVLDELSQVTASCICINSNDKIEVRYINENLTQTSNKVGSNITETTIKAPIQLNGILGDMEQNGTPTPSTPIDIDVVTGLQNVTINDTTYPINLGKNLLSITNGDKTGAGIKGTWNNGNLIYSGTASNTYATITIQTDVDLPIGNYVFSINHVLTFQCRLKLTYEDNTAQDITILAGDLSKEFTTSKVIKKIYVYFNGLTQNTYYEGSVNCMLEKGTTATEYAPYFTPIELCKIGDYQDKIYKSSGKWYLEKQIGKVVLNGSEQGWNVFFSTNGIYVLANYIQSKTSGTDIQCKSNYFDATTRANIRNNLGTVDNVCATNGGEIILANKSISSLNDFKTWLGTHNTTLYTILATPETTEITNTELINQLNALYNAKSNNGTTNIVIYGDLSAILDVNLGKSRETINEDYLKNINVTFGEKYGPVNSIVLSRSANSDNIYKKDDASIEENGLCELKISDNQIMNFNDRDTYLNEIFDRLNGLEYFINDFDSPGITYLELLDKYDIQIEDEIYNCILLNDEIEINKGISERIFTDALEDSKTDYTKSDKTDRKINQAYIIVDKQNQTITALTSRTNDIENNETNHYNELLNEFSNYAPLTSVDTLTTQVNQIQTDTYTKTQIQEIANGTGVDGVTVTAVVSTEAQFDKDGMHYSKTDAPTNSTIDYKGFEVDDKNGKEIFYAGYDEDDQSPTYGTSIVRTDNINVDTYLQFGNNKGRFEEFEDADGNVGIGLFLM